MRHRLLVVLLGGALLLCGCTSRDGAGPAVPPTPDDVAVSRTVDDTRHLRDDALAVAAGTRKDADDLRRIAADHDAALAALGAAPGAVTSAPSTTPSTTDATETVSQQLTAEWGAARSALRDGLAADDDGLAVLLVRIAATRAAHADRLAGLADRDDLPALKPAPAPPIPAAARTPTPMPTPTAADPGLPTATPAPAAPDTGAERALERLLAGEHAAVFAYPALLPRLSGADRDRAAQLWVDHRTARNELTARLLAAGVEPAVAAPAYEVGTVGGAADARGLAGRVETGIAALAADVIGSGTDAADRRFAADDLVLAARRAARWTGRTVPLPGAASTPAASTPAASPTRSPAPGPAP